MNSVVIYKSKYGTTKKYAEWTAEKIGAEIFESKEFNTADFKKYDTILYFGGVYTGSIANIGVITNNYDEISDKNIIVCPVCLTKAENTDGISELLANNFNYKMFDKVKVFPLRGAIDYKKLKFLDKLMIKSAVATIQDKMVLNQDYVSIENINPIVEYVEGLKK